MTLTRNQLLLGAKSVLGEKLTCDPYSISDGREFNVVEPDATNGWRYAQNGAYRGSLNEGAVVQRAMVLAALEEEEPPEEDIGVQRDRWRELARYRYGCLEKIENVLRPYLQAVRRESTVLVIKEDLIDVQVILKSCIPS